MKRLNILNIGFALIIGLTYFTSCEKDPIKTEYTRYDPTPVTMENANLVYEPLIAYPELLQIKTDTPTFVIDGVYAFKLDTITSTVENGFNPNDFNIDADYGVITYDNSDGTILPGKYNVSVSISNITGIAVFDQASEIEILGVPITVSINDSTVDAGALEQGVIATLSYTDESPDQSITSVEYSLVPAVTGFFIDSSTGDISKNTEAESGVHELSIFAETNLGGKSFPNLLTVTVGPPPSISYLQIDGVSLLTKVTLSPWTAYTTQAPILNDMVATQWEIILPGGLDASAVSIAADGKFSVLSDQNISVGDYSIGIKATNASGASFEFPDQFILHVETRWEIAPVFFEDFNNTTTTPDPVNIYNSALSSYVQNGGHISGLFVAIRTENATKDQMFQSARMSEGKVDGNFDSHFETSLLLELTIDPTWYNLRVSFNDLFGFGDNRLDWYNRTLGFAYSNTDVLAGTYDPANWNIIMDANDPDWAGSSGTGQAGARDSDMNKIPAKDLGGIDNTQSKIYINWWVGEVDVSTKGAVFHFDDLKVEASTAFVAIEE